MKYLLIDIEKSTSEEVLSLMRMSPNILTEEQTLKKLKEIWDNAVLYNIQKEAITEDPVLLSWEEYAKHL